MRLSLGVSALVITLIVAATLMPVRDVQADFWPATWTPYLKSSNLIEDAGLDSTPGGTDIVGNTSLSYASAFYAWDGVNLFFRLRLRSYPGTSAAFSNYAWVVLFDTNNNVTHYEWALYLDGVSEKVQLRHNTVQTGGFTDTAEVGFDIGSAATYARSIVADSSLHGSVNYFIDWYMPWSTFTNKTGLTSTSTMRMFFATAYSTSDYSKDKVGGDPATLPDAWGDTVTFAASGLYTLTILVGNGEPSLNHGVKIDGVTYLTNTTGYVATKVPAGTHSLEILPKNTTSTNRSAFKQWTDGDTNNPRNVSVSANVIFSAVLKLQYSLTVTSPYDSPTGTGWYDTATNATFSVTSPVTDSPGRRRVATGFTLDSTSYTGTSGYVIMNAPHTVIFNWKTQYLLALNTQPASLDNPTGASWYDSGTTATISTDEIANTTSTSRYHFTQWTGAITSTNRTTSTTMNTAKNATAQYHLEQKATVQISGCSLSLTITIDSQQYTPPISQFYDNSSTHTFSAPATATNSSDQGHRCMFQSWSGLKNSTSATIQLTVTTPGTLTANYLTQYRLEVMTDPFAVTPQPNGTGWYSGNTNASLTAPTVTNYTFYAWYLDGASQGVGVNPITVQMNISHTAIATYTGPSYRVQINSIGLPTPSVSTHVFADGRDLGRPYLYDGQNRSIGFLPSSTHTIQAFRYIYLGSGIRLHDANCTISVSTNSTITFTHHREILVTVTTSGLASSQSRATIMLEAANVADIDRTRKPLSLYDGNPTTIWIHNNTIIWVSSMPVSVSTTTRFIVISSSPIQATTPGTYTFQFQLQHRLTITVYPYYLYTRISGTGWYNQNQQVSMTAPPVRGWKLNQWLVDGTPQTASGTTFTILMDRPHSVTAKYLPDRSSTTPNILQMIIDWLFGRSSFTDVTQTDAEDAIQINQTPVTATQALLALASVLLSAALLRRQTGRGRNRQLSH